MSTASETAVAATPAPPTTPDAASGRTWWALAPSQVAEAVSVTPEEGLSADAAADRRAEVGPNVPREHATTSVWTLPANQFKSLIIGLLLAAALVAVLVGDVLEGWAVVIVIVINTAIGFGTEWRAVRSMEALLLGAVYVPVVAGVLHVQSPSLAGWGVVLSMSLLPPLVGQVVLVVRREGVER